MKGRKFTNEEVACAYELINSGVPWKTIERYLGAGIRWAVKRAKILGMSKP